MKYILMLCLFFKTLSIYCQATYEGNKLSPIDTVFVLNIFVNIEFDQDSTLDLYYGKTTPHWLPGDTASLNSNPPAYLLDFMDNTLYPNPHGKFTKRFAEASFNNLILIGDFCVVNIPQSFITPSSPNL